VNGTYDLGATGIQFKDVHFSGSIYNNGTLFQGGVSGLVYRATGPTGPTGGSTGPTGPTLQTSAHILPTTDLAFDLGATGLRFRDIYVGGASIHMGDSVVLKASGNNFSVTTPAGTNDLVSSTYGPDPAQIATAFTPQGVSESPYIQGTGDGAIRSIATSADGSYLSAVFVNVTGSAPSISVHIPTDDPGEFTINKTSITGGLPFTAIAMSASGERQIAVQESSSSSTGGGIYVSSDYGTTWAEEWRSGDNARDFVAAAATSTLWFAASATSFVYATGAAGSIASWTTVSSYTNKESIDPVDFTGITQIQVSNDGQYLIVLDSTNLEIVLYSLSSLPIQQVGTDLVYDLAAYTSPIISNLTETGGFSVLAINGSAQPSILNYSNDPAEGPIEIVIPATGVTTPKFLISSQDSTFKLAVFNTEVENATAAYLSSNYGINWTELNDYALADITSILFSATANITYVVRYENAATQQSLRISIANSIYTENSSLPYTPAVPGDWPSAPTTITAAVDQLATVAFLPTVNPSGSYTDPVSNVTVTGPILSMGATGSAGPIILQAGLSATHVLELYTATGPNIAYAQNKSQPGSYTLNTVYGPSGPDVNNNLFAYLPNIVFNTSRGYATGPTGLQHQDLMGAIFFNDQNTPLAYMIATKLGPTGSSDVSLNFGAGAASMTLSSTGPTNEGVPTGPVGPNIALSAHMYPTSDATYDLGATGYQFRDVHFSGSLYNNGTPFSGGGAATYPTGSYKDPVTNVTVTGPILSMGATGSAGPIILQAGLSATHILEKYTATGPNIAYSQVKTQPGSYTLNTVYGPDGAGEGPTNLLNNTPQLTFNTMRGYATGPTDLQDGDLMGALFFKEQNTVRGFITAAKVGEGEHASMNFNVGGGFGIMSINSTGPIGPTGDPTGPVGPNIALTADMYPTDDAYYDLGASGLQFKDVYFSGSLYNNGTPFSGGGGVIAPTDNFSVAVGTGTGKLVYSYDGKTWTNSTSAAALFTGSCVSVAWNGSIWVAVGDTIAYSSDGIFWTQSISGQAIIYSNEVAPTTVAWGGSLWLVGCTNNSAILYSTDGINWTLSPSAYSLFGGAGSVRSLAYNGTMWLAGGSDGTNGIVAYSYDGISWSNTGSTIFGISGRCNAIAWNGSIWVAVGYNNSLGGIIIYSYDGMTWYNTGQTRINNNCFTVAWNGSIWLAGGEIDGGTNQIAYSYNGISWYSTGQSIIDNRCNTLAWNGSLWVAGGYDNSANGVIMYGSYDDNTEIWTWTNSGSALLTPSSIASRKPLPLVGAGVGSTPGLYYRASGPTGPTGGSTGPTGPQLQLTAHIIPTTDATYDLGATGIQFRDVHFSGSLYNNGTPFSGGGGITGLTYRATGPTGPDGSATGPSPDATIQIGTHLVPTQDLSYDLGATGLRFRDLYVGGSTIYLGDSVTLSGSAGTLSVNSAPLVSSSTVPNTGAGGIGVTFTSKTLPAAMNNSNPGNIAMSANGQYITYLTSYSGYSGYIKVSSDYGESFTDKGDTNLYNYVTVSSTGQYQAALLNKTGEEDNGGIFFSTDYGETWANVGFSTVSSWGGIRISTDGQIVIAWESNNSYYYITKDMVPENDDSWISGNYFSYTPIDLLISANGDRVLYIYSNHIQGYKVNRSGASTNISTSPAGSISLTPSPFTVSLSSDGTRIGVYGNYSTSNITISNQYTWSISGSGSITPVGGGSPNYQITASASWANYNPNSAMSSDGAVQIVIPAGNGYGAYISYNYGVTWSAIAQTSPSTPNIAGTNWYYVLISSNALYINLFPAGGSTGWAQCLATTPTLTLTNIPYTPAAPLTWPTNYIPTTIGGALDTIAKYLNTSQQMNAWTNLP
jgi:hypothetical protein